MAGTQRSDEWRATARIRLARPKPGGAVSIRPPVACGDAVFVDHLWIELMALRDDICATNGDLFQLRALAVGEVLQLQ